MGRLVKLITVRQEAERARLAAAGQLPPGQEAQLDPSKLEFVRSMYAYDASDPLELSLKPNDIVAVLSRNDPQTGQESTWWRGRTRDGRIGWFPST
jgi:peroxin-13